MAGAHIEEVSTEQVLFATVTDANLSHSDKILVFTDIIRKAFVTQGVDFAGNDKTVSPNFYEHGINIKFLFQVRRISQKN